MKSRTLLIACLSLSAATGHAAPFTNGSFETASVDPGAGFVALAAGSTAISGWTVTAGDIDYIGGYWQPGEGARSLDMSGCLQGTIEQTFDTVPGAYYRVDFLMAGNPDLGPIVKTMDVSAAGVTTAYSFDTTGFSRSNMGWSERSFGFAADTASTTLSFANTSGATCAGAALDHVRVSRQVEVPVGGAPWQLLLVLGIFGVLAWNSRRQG